MPHHSTLHRAVVLALGCIAISAQQSALALGLGDIEVKSFLNEPLQANIQVLGATEATDASCFKLASDNADQASLGHLNLKLGAGNSGAAAVLSLTGSKPVNEPIVNLKLIAGCGANVQREYVLLIDPLLPNVATKPAIASIAATAKVDTIDEKSAKTIPVNPIINDKTTLILPSATVKKSAPKRVSHKQTTHKGSPTQNVATTKAVLPSIAPAPKLTLSGDSEVTPIDTAFKLRLDKQLSVSASSEPLAQTSDLQDEVTAMRNRMAHLQAQIANLEQTNRALTSKNKGGDTQTLMHQPLTWLASTRKNPSTWLGGALILLAGYCGFVWLRRRQRRLQQARSGVLFMAAENQPALYDHDEFHTPHEDDIFSDVAPSVTSHNAENTSASQNIFSVVDAVNQPIVLEEDNETLSILDHADVFLSHGRASLAIQLLQNHLIDFPRQSVTIWLFLLDLLTKENLAVTYETTAVECRKYFNIKIPEFAALPQANNDLLESFPRLLDGLQMVWNTPEAIHYLNDLIYNTRAEPRIGLDKNLLEELILLKAVAQETQSTAEVIQFEDKKIARIEQKQAQTAKKASSERGLDEGEAVAGTETFEFDLVEYQ